MISSMVSHKDLARSVAFFIYINDLPLSLKFSKVNMYADDTIISFSTNSIYTVNNAINEDLMLLKTA